MAICPECESPLDIDQDSLSEGDTLECDDCGAELEVVSLEPIELILAEPAGFDEEEDSYNTEEES